MTLVERRTTTDVAEGDPESTGAAEPGTSRPELRLVLLFLAIGAATTILHLGAFAALREQWSAQWSNTAALAVATVANTWANRRWTFGVTVLIDQVDTACPSDRVVVTLLAVGRDGYPDGALEASPSPVYGAALLMRFGLNAHRGFKSLRLRHRIVASDLRQRRSEVFTVCVACRIRVGPAVGEAHLSGCRE